MATEREFRLTGSFDDQITKKLKKINSEVAKLSKSFDKFNKRVAPTTKGMNKFADASMRANKALKEQKTGFESSLQSARQYTTQMRKAHSTAVKLSKVKPPKAFPKPRGGGGSRGGGGRQVSSGPGFGTLALATAAGGGGLMMVTAAFTKVKNAAMGLVSAGSQAEQATIQMAGTLQTLGKIGDFQKSTVMAEKMMGDLSKVAAALPGSTQDYLSVLQQTLDDQIEAFGSVEAVQKNLAGIDPKTGEKLKGEMEGSFTALFGMTAQIAGMAPQIAAMDINQLRASPTNVDRNIQIFTRNPTLKKFYLEELEKTGGDFFMALNNAMGRAITPEQVEALKQSYDSALQTLITTFNDPYSGIFGYAKKIKRATASGGEETVSVMTMLGRVMRQINGLIEVAFGQVGSDFIVSPLIELLDEINFWLWYARKWLEHYTKEGQLGISKFGEFLGKFATDLGLELTNSVLNYNWGELFTAIDDFIFGLGRGIKKALSDYDWSKTNSAVKNALEGFLGTVSGLLVTLTAAVLIANKKIAGVSLMSAFGGTAGKVAGKAAGKVGKQTTNAFKAMPGVAKGGKAVKALATAGKMKGLGVLAAGAVTLATHSPKLAKVGKAVSAIGKRIPLLNVAFAGLDFASKKAAGQSTAQAASGAGGGLAGGIIGGAIGTAIVPVVGTAIGGVLGSFIGEWLGSRLPKFFASIPGLLQAGWKGLSGFFTKTIPNFFTNLPYKVGFVIGKSIKLVGDYFKFVWKFWTEIVPDLILSAIKWTIEKLTSIWGGFVDWVVNLPKTIGKAFTNFISFAQTLPGETKNALMNIGTTIVNWVKELPGRIGNAIKNSGGGFLSGIFSGMGSEQPDGPKGGSGTRFQSMAKGFGLEMTSFMRPGDQGSYHSIGRAMDFSNSTGPTKEMGDFAKTMVAMYGKNLKELIYTPLGFSVKNGQMVPPMSQEAHNNHVHVAWNKGNVAPLLEEMKYKPQGSQLGVANSSETVLNTGQTALLSKALQGGGGTVINNNIQIDGAQDPDAVAAAILNAMKQMEQSTIS